MESQNNIEYKFSLLVSHASDGWVALASHIALKGFFMGQL